MYKQLKTFHRAPGVHFAFVDFIFKIQLRCTMRIVSQDVFYCFWSSDLNHRKVM